MNGAIFQSLLNDKISNVELMEYFLIMQSRAREQRLQNERALIPSPQELMRQQRFSFFSFCEQKNARGISSFFFRIF